MVLGPAGDAGDARDAGDGDHGDHGDDCSDEYEGYYCIRKHTRRTSNAFILRIIQNKWAIRKETCTFFSTVGTLLARPTVESFRATVGYAGHPAGGTPGTHASAAGVG